MKPKKKFSKGDRVRVKDQTYWSAITKVASEAQWNADRGGWDYEVESIQHYKVAEPNLKDA